MLLAVLLGAPPAFGQAETPTFAIDLVSTHHDSKDDVVRVDLYTMISYANLRFISSADGFKARYEVTADVHEVDRRGRPRNLVQSPIWDRELIAADYNEASDPTKSDKLTHTIELEPGTYFIEFQLEDLASNEVSVQQVTTEIRSFDRPVAMSDMIFLDDYEVTSNVINPRITTLFTTAEEALTVFYDVHADAAQDVRIKRFIVKKPMENNPSLWRRILGNPVGQDDDQEEEAGLAFEDEQTSTLRAGSNPFIATLPLTDLPPDDYIVRIAVVNAEGEELDATSRNITLEWSGLDDHIGNIDEAIAQLSAIADPKEIREIQAATSAGMRTERFLEFWKKRDPTPGTPRNEKMIEYYYRVASADQRFGRDGWRSDRGNILIRYGMPEHIARHPYTFNNKAYEVWEYQRFGRRFIFVDQTGLNDYRLLVPSWDERTRF
ncbi:MAG: GWxTD domain-containing protein [Bacteroidota bacterium]